MGSAINKWFVLLVFIRSLISSTATGCLFQEAVSPVLSSFIYSEAALITMKKSEKQQCSKEEVENIWKGTLHNILPDIYTHWDPMGDTFHSPLNRYLLDPRDVSAGQHCIFYDGFSETCCMGDNCRALHVKRTGPRTSGSVVAEKRASTREVRKVKGQDERVSSAHDLDRRGVATPASIFKAVASYAESPFNFFLVPQFDLNCACTGTGTCSPEVNLQKCVPHKDPFSKPKNGSEKTGSGIEDYNAIVMEKSNEMWKRCGTNRFCNDYIRCELYGIRPKRKTQKHQMKPEPQWSADAINDFKKLVKSPGELMDTRELETKNLLIVEVKKTKCGDSDGVSQSRPYSVMITVTDEDNNREAVNVSEEMVKLGHAEFTNFDPECGFSFSEWEFLNPLSSLC